MRKPAEWRAGLARRLGLDHNELRRASDRIEAWLQLVLIVAFVPLAVLAASAVASSVDNAGAHELRAGVPLRQVTAVLLPWAPATGSWPGASARSWEPARWTADGVTHTGNVPADPGAPAGTVIRIWVNPAGQAQPPPLTADQVAARAALAAVATPPAVALWLWLAWRGLRWRLDRHRLASWARAWSQVESQWTR
jgi:hypothetical protein